MTEKTATNLREDDLKGAIRQLASSLDGLESAVERHIDDKDRMSSLDGEMDDIVLDRSRLAQSLDRAEARSGRLEEANKEVSRRLVNAMETIRSIIESQAD
ncbi:MAG: DUF4164 family protein [Hyphomicrobiales bacterium]